LAQDKLLSSGASKAAPMALTFKATSVSGQTCLVDCDVYSLSVARLKDELKKALSITDANPLQVLVETEVLEPDSAELSSFACLQALPAGSEVVVTVVRQTPVLMRQNTNELVEQEMAKKPTVLALYCCVDLSCCLLSACALFTGLKEVLSSACALQGSWPWWLRTIGAFGLLRSAVMIPFAKYRSAMVFGQVGKHFKKRQIYHRQGRSVEADNEGTLLKQSGWRPHLLVSAAFFEVIWKVISFGMITYGAIMALFMNRDCEVTKLFWIYPALYFLVHACNSILAKKRPWL